MPSPSPIAVLGGGLAGSLLALALARRGLPVLLVAPRADGATPLSYGGIPTRRARRHWRRLQSLHGPLGFAPTALALHGWPAPLAWLPPRLQAALTAPLRFGRVDPPALLSALPAALAAAGVERLSARVLRLVPDSAGAWSVLVQGPESSRPPLQRSAAQVVLAAGAGSRALWPDLPERFSFSWAGVIALSPATLATAAQSGWLAVARRGALLQPLHLRRPALERSTPAEERWIVDAGVVAWGQEMLLGQISLVGPALDPALPPDPARMEARLRRELARLDPQLAGLPGRYLQAPVAHCCGGPPLVGPLPDGPAGLWCFTGFSGSFSVVPALAEELADRIAAAAGHPPAAPGPDRLAELA